MKKALITGITGQDGSYAELLLRKAMRWNKEDQVHSILQGLITLSRSSWKNPIFILHYGDLTDSSV